MYKMECFNLICYHLVTRYITLVITEQEKFPKIQGGPVVPCRNVDSKMLFLNI